MSAFSQDQILVASLAFMESMRREYLQRFGEPEPGKPVLPKSLGEYSPLDQRSLIQSIHAALRAADPANVARVMSHINTGASAE